MYSMNVKTAEPIGPKFCVGPHMTPENVYEKKNSAMSLQQNSIVIKFRKSTKFFIKFANIFLTFFLLRENVHN